jgi:hypothetical protein
MAYLLGCGIFALAALLVISVRRPLLDERFTSLYTTQLLPLAGTALAWTGRRWLMALAVVVLAAVTVVEVATLGTPDVPAAIAPLRGRVDPTRDIVALNGPYRYFQVLYYGDQGVREATRVVSAAVPWYEGLAAYRPGDIVPAVPDVPGTVYLVTDPGQDPPPMPGGRQLAARHCARGTCLETWTR